MIPAGYTLRRDGVPYNMIFESEWWCVDLPSNWSDYLEGDCVTFRAEVPLGVLQIAAARKNTGFVTDRDLIEFVEQRITPQTKLDSVSFRAFSGVTAKYRKDGLSWQEWWLRSKHLMIYATYNVVQENETEQRTVEHILASLVAKEH